MEGENWMWGCRVRVEVRLDVEVGGVAGGGF